MDVFLCCCLSNALCGVCVCLCPFDDLADDQSRARGSCVIVTGDPSRAARGDFLRALADQQRRRNSRRQERRGPRNAGPQESGELEPSELELESASPGNGGGLGRLDGRFEDEFFGPSFTVALAALKWKSKRVEVAVLNRAAVIGAPAPPAPQALSTEK